MSLQRSLTLTILLSVSVSAACSKETVKPSPTSTSLTANTALNNLPTRPFERHVLNSSGFHVMNEFIRPDVRSRMDEEPVGDSDGEYDPSTLEAVTSGEEVQPDSSEAQTENVEADAGPAEESDPAGSKSDSMKFAWARKSFGDAVKATPTSNGVIVLYADENVYDINSLIAFVEDGRNRIAEKSDIGSDRIQVVFGGYRGAPQVELWIMPDGSLPELKQDDRSKPEN